MRLARAAASLQRPRPDIERAHRGGSRGDQGGPVRFAARRRLRPMARPSGSFLQNGKSSIAVTKSIGFGRTWSAPTIVENLQRATDKDELAVRGQTVAVSFNAVQKIYAAVSHDGGATWSTHLISDGSAQLGWSLGGGAGIDSVGNLYFAFAGYTQNGGAKGPVNLYVSESRDGGVNWTSTLVGVSGAPYPCPSLRLRLPRRADDARRRHGRQRQPALECDRGPDGLRAGAHLFRPLHRPRRQLYTASGRVAGGQRRRATPSRRSWWALLGETCASPGWTCAPAIGTSSTDPAAMAARVGSPRPRSRASRQGITTAPRQDSGLPYGDYFQLAVDNAGGTQIAWGEAASYAGPGNIWTAHSASA